MDITGKTALVTGAARRIGRACALALAEAGADIILHYHMSSEEAEETASMIRDMGRRSFPLTADLGNPDEIDALWTAAAEVTGRPDILVNSASVFPEGTFRDSLTDDYLRCSRVNSLAPLHLSRLFALRPSEGVIINFLDARLTDYDREHFPYHISKRELFTQTRALAVELAPGIRVNGIAPGLILPPPGYGPDYLEERISSNPLKRIGNLDQITGALLFLVRNDFITGQIIYIDGGRHLRGRMYGE
jgi:NAD(P)-dependent dehydrogenase (short-subunit alcohol dehydrogenase family)